MFIGEGPGRDENLSGRPFVGRAGHFLTDIIEQEFKLQRRDVFICNVVKCRPTIDMKKVKDRQPDPEEIEACVPYLLEQIDIIKPLVLITLGNPATQCLLKITEGITKLHGSLLEFNGIPVMPMYHPSYVIRNGGHSSKLKKDIIEDISNLFKVITDIC
jgi:DNA polymerase